MQCKCGHEFVHAVGGKATEELRSSYALIADRDYRKFLKLELKALQADTAAKRRAAILKSSKFVGFAMDCPKCKRLVIYRPEADRVQFYVVDHAQAKPRTSAAKRRRGQSRT